MKNRRVPRMGPEESSWERHSIQLAYCGPKANMGPIEHPHTHGYVIHRFGLPKQGSSDDICSVVTTVYTISWRFNVMQFMSHTQQCLLAIRAKRCPRTCMCKVCHVPGGKESITKAASLSNEKSLVQRGQP